MGWDRIGKGREGKERLGYCGDRYLPDTLSLSLSLSWVSADSYLPYKAVYVCT